ncbi:MAG: alpha/beta hydrolase-fold protein [Caldilineaceae bacterium]
MSFIQLDFFSETLQLASSMNVLLPRTTQAQRDKLGADHRYPVLYLLHGMSDDHTAWTRYTSLERYTRYLNLAVIMPAVHRTSYTNMHQGGRYWTFISQEVPALAHSLFPISTKRAETFTAGLSMGGYGAFKLALRQPERFSYAASLSGAVDMAQRVANPDPAASRKISASSAATTICSAATTISCTWQPRLQHRAAPNRRSTNAAAPKTSFTRTTCASVITYSRSATTTSTKKVPANTSGATGISRSSASWRGCRSKELTIDDFRL